MRRTLASVLAAACIAAQPISAQYADINAGIDNVGQEETLRGELKLVVPLGENFALASIFNGSLEERIGAGRITLGELKGTRVVADVSNAGVQGGIAWYHVWESNLTGFGGLSYAGGPGALINVDYQLNRIMRIGTATAVKDTYNQFSFTSDVRVGLGTVRDNPQSYEALIMLQGLGDGPLGLSLRVQKRLGEK